ncbi:MAG: nucleotidyltransferase domain-containing protein, partial [Halodesulfurarchaeum sp.]
ETVGTNLTRLKERNLVRHQEPYWAFTDDREAALETLRERYDQAFVTELRELGLLDTQQVPSGQKTDDQVTEKTGTGEKSAADSTEPTARDSAEGEQAQSVHQQAAQEFFERVHDRLGSAVEKMYLFGSVAADTETTESDVDVLAVIADDASVSGVDDELLQIAYEVQLAFGVRLEVHSLSSAEFRSRKADGDPFVRTVIEEGIRDVR